MRIALFLFWVTVMAGSMALPQATTPAPATRKPSAPAPKKAPPTAASATKTSPTAADHKATATKTGTAKTGTTSRTGTSTKTGTTSKTGKTLPKSTKSGKKTPAVVRQRSQTAPTPERYKDIQTALVEKGYLHGEPTGVWDADSIDALRRFQTDQKLSPTGKISAASLIGLGLGPKPQDDSPLPPPVGPLTPPPAEQGAAPPPR